MGERYKYRVSAATGRLLYITLSCNINCQMHSPLYSYLNTPVLIHKGISKVYYLVK